MFHKITETHLYVGLCVFCFFRSMYVKCTVLSAGSLGDIVRESSFNKAVYSYYSHKCISQTYLYLILLTELLTGMCIFRHFLYLYELSE